jgi:hypothetical protein
MRARVGGRSCDDDGNMWQNMPKPPNPPVPRSRNRFRERELARAVRAAKSAGGERVEIDPTGKISIVIGKPGESESKNSWDDVLTDAAHKNRTA